MVADILQFKSKKRTEKKHVCLKIKKLFVELKGQNVGRKGRKWVRGGSREGLKEERN